jgi:peptide/nickel transport system ATP-binding protein
MSDRPIVAIEGLTVDLPAWGDRRHAIENVSLEVRANEILCVVGESGSGKSILARSIMGLFPSPHVRPSAGRVMLEGDNLLAVSPGRLREIRGSRLAMVFQEPMTALNPLLTIGRQIHEVLAVHGRGTLPERQRRVLEILAQVHLPEPARIAEAYPHQLSGGQRQRAMIAMALVLGPECLIADEPTTALDVTTQAQILALIRELQHERGTGVLFITHDFGVVAEIADRIAVMQSGRVVELGEASDILYSPKHPYTRSLIAAVPSLRPPVARRSFADQVFSIEGLSKSFRTGGGLFGRSARVVHAAKSVTLSVRKGETVGIVGESGSGKSTLARCASRLIEPDAGRIVIGGTDFSSLSGEALRRFRKKVQLIFQDPYGSLDPRQKVGSIVAEGPLLHRAPPERARKRALELLELVGLDARAAERYPHEFSGGQRQRIGIARALALEPELLIADEPVSALDVSVQAQVLGLLTEIRDRLGLSMLFITHDLRVAAQVCDTIAVMRSGEIVERAPTSQIFASPQHAYTQQLFAAVPGKDWAAHHGDSP